MPESKEAVAVNMKKQNRGLYIWIGLIFLVSQTAFCGCGKREEVLLFSAEETEMVEKTENSPIPTSVPIEQEAPVTIFVDVSGAVKKPGVYELKEGTRIYQAVEAAGGFTLDACRDRMNLASVLQDEQHIFIPSESDPEPMSEEVGQQSDVSANMDGGDDKININQAGLEQLCTLTGIGETRAKAILQYREEHGAFSSVEEIMNVQGIKEGTFAKIKDEIVVQ